MSQDPKQFDKSNAFGEAVKLAKDKLRLGSNLFINEWGQQEICKALIEAIGQAIPSHVDALDCPHCKGSGEITAYDTTRGPDGESAVVACPECLGSGERTTCGKLNDGIPCRLPAGTKCPDCAPASSTRLPASFAVLADVHRGWCNYCKGVVEVCRNAPEGGCSLRDVERETAGEVAEPSAMKLEHRRRAVASAIEPSQWEQKYKRDLFNFLRLEAWIELKYPGLMDEFEASVSSDGGTDG